MKPRTIEDFYDEIRANTPLEIAKELGHFNVFDVEQLYEQLKEKKVMPYDRRAYYKISLIKGRNKAEYANKVINIDQPTLLFATPRVPYHWQPQDLDQHGHFCVFTTGFITKNNSGFSIDQLPIFKASGVPVFALSLSEEAEVDAIFRKMHREINTSYEYKFDLLRNYTMELIHLGQKLQPATDLLTRQNAATRIASLFLELLERQFPIESAQQQIQLRTAKDFADRLAVHVNYLNSVIKQVSGKTTTGLISARVAEEARLLLRQTSWNISEIAYALGFEEVAHFSNFFKKQAGVSPLHFRV